MKALCDKDKHHSSTSAAAAIACGNHQPAPDLLSLQYVHARVHISYYAGHTRKNTRRKAQMQTRDDGQLDGHHQFN